MAGAKSVVNRESRVRRERRPLPLQPEGSLRRVARMKDAPGSLLVLVAVGAAAWVHCASPAAAQARRSHYVRVADALTAATLAEPMRVAPRMFSPYPLSEACRRPARIDRLEAPSRTIEMRAGDRLALASLRVVAVSDANAAVAGVPVAIEAEERDPSPVLLRSDDPDLNEGRLHAVSAGTFRLRIRTLCAAVNAAFTIRVNVRGEASQS
jgi:hypothetical protein